MSDFQAKRISQVAQFGDISLDFRKMELCRGGSVHRNNPAGIQSAEVLDFQTEESSFRAKAHKLRLAKTEAFQLPHGGQLHREAAAENREESGLPRLYSNRSRGWLQVCSSGKCVPLLAESAE